MSEISNDNELRIGIYKNIKLCLDFGYGTLKSAKSEIEYRNAIISIHNGLELIMKLYLQRKDKNLIYDKIDHYVLMNDRNDLIKEIDCKKTKLNTIKFAECINILSHFEEIPEKYVHKLNKMRNDYIHYEGIIYKNESRKILILYIYPFIKKLVNSMGLGLTLFISENNIDAIEKQNRDFSDRIRMRFLEKIEIAKKHYNDELTEEDRKEKLQYQDYRYEAPCKLVTCPACANKALLNKNIESTSEEHENYYIVRKNIILKNLMCHHCGLNIDERDLLLLHYTEEEESLPDARYYRMHFLDEYIYDCPDDCPPDDCPYDCLDDCPDDCPPDDCLDDCPDDCPPEYQY